MRCLDFSDTDNKLLTNKLLMRVSLPLLLLFWFCLPSSQSIIKFLSFPIAYQRSQILEKKIRRRRRKEKKHTFVFVESSYCKKTIFYFDSFLQYITQKLKFIAFIKWGIYVHNFQASERENNFCITAWSIQIHLLF